MISDTTKWFLNKATYFGDPLDAETKQWLQARIDEADKIDPATAEMTFGFCCGDNPYYIAHDAEDNGCVGRTEFARNPGSDIWVWFYDLPEPVVDALWARPDSKYLHFPYGLPGYPSNAKEEAEMTEKYNRQKAGWLVKIHKARAGWDADAREQEVRQLVSDYLEQCRPLQRTPCVFPKDGTDFERGRLQNDLAWLTGALLAGHAIGARYPGDETDTFIWVAGTLDDILADQYADFEDELKKPIEQSVIEADLEAKRAREEADLEAMRARDEAARAEQARESVRLTLEALPLDIAMKVLKSAGVKGLAYLPEDRFADVIAAAKGAAA